MINKLCKTTRNTSSLMYEIILMYRKTIMKIHRTLRLSGFTLYQMGPIDSWDFSNDCLRFFRCCSRLFSCVQSFCPSEILRILLTFVETETASSSPASSPGGTSWQLCQTGASGCHRRPQRGPLIGC